MKTLPWQHIKKKPTTTVTDLNLQHYGLFSVPSSLLRFNSRLKRKMKAHSEVTALRLSTLPHLRFLLDKQLLSLLLKLQAAWWSPHYITVVRWTSWVKSVSEARRGEEGKLRGWAWKQSPAAQSPPTLRCRDLQNSHWAFGIVTAKGGQSHCVRNSFCIQCSLQLKYGLKTNLMVQRTAWLESNSNVELRYHM